MSQLAGFSPVILPSLSGHATGSEPGIITQYIIDTSYGWDNGLVGLPTAAPDGAAQSIVKTHAMKVRKFIQWTVERELGRPVCPHWDTQCSNEVLIFKNLVVANPLYNVDGNPVWRISGAYVYELLTPPRFDMSGGSLVAGYMPYDPWATQMYIDGNLFSKTFLNAGDSCRTGGFQTAITGPGPPPSNPTLPTFIRGT